jgi:hypothetical protein
VIGVAAKAIFFMLQLKHGKIRKEIAETAFETAIERRQPVRISSPRLVNREQIADFKLEVIKEANAAE